nr:flavodoxin family protein [Rhodococcus sp. (in: high G+C Gram-positive bacteria)]
MKTIVVSASKSSHQNTRRIAEIFGDTLNARVISPEMATPAVLAQADRIGFGSGVYWMNFDPQLVECIRKLPDMSGRVAFVFATSGLPELPFRRYTHRLGLQLEERGFRVIGSFSCRGVDTWGPFGMIGGVSKGRPNQHDLTRAKRCAEQIAVH